MSFTSTALKWNQNKTKNLIGYIPVEVSESVFTLEATERTFDGGLLLSLTSEGRTQGMLGMNQPIQG